MGVAHKRREKRSESHNGIDPSKSVEAGCHHIMKLFWHAAIGSVEECLKGAVRLTRCAATCTQSH